MGCQGFGTEYRLRSNGKLQGDINRVDFVANAGSLGATSIGARTREELKDALGRSRSNPHTTVVVVEVDGQNARVPGYESWWDVPVAEVSNMESVETARKPYVEGRKRERHYL